MTGLNQVKEEFQPKVSLSVPDAYKAPEGFFTNTFDKDSFTELDEDEDEEDDNDVEVLDEFNELDPLIQNICMALMDNSEEEVLSVLIRFMLRF